MLSLLTFFFFFFFSRNDLTILDAIAINGAGAYPQLTLEGLDQSAGNLIKFVIPYETLKLCEGM